jgi:ribokinase
VSEHGRPGPSVLCVGNLTVDEVVRGGVHGDPALGGDAAYAALAARLHVDDVAMLAPVGHDVPEQLLSGLRDAGVRADELPERDRATVRNVITYHDDGSRTWDMQSSEEDFDVLSVYPADVPSWALDSDAIVLSAMSLESQLALTPWLREHSSATLYLDLQEDYLEGNRDALAVIIAACDVFMPSEVEAVALAGTSDVVEAARIFRALGPRTVVVKRAERGSLVLDGDTLVEVPTEVVRAPVDSTGAGDAYCGAFAAVHTATGDPVEAARAGSRAARFAIGSFGIDGLLAVAQGVHRSGARGSTSVADLGATR